MFKHTLLYVWIVQIGMFVAAGFIRPASEGPYVTQASTKADGTKDSQPDATTPTSVATTSNVEAIIHRPSELREPNPLVRLLRNAGFF